MSHRRLVAFLLTCHVGSLLACWGGAGEDEDEDTIKGIMLDPNNVNNWGGFNPPPGAEEAWSTWLQNYKKHNEGKGGVHDPNLHGKYPYGHNEIGWPSDWSGMGPPITGMAPPPWAYVPKKTGKPSFCFEPAQKGNCSENLWRYGYNAFMDECQYFRYSGCGGNRNNFEDLKNCQKACMAVPQSGCEDDSKLPINSFVWSRRCGYSADEPNDYLAIKNY